MPLFAGPCAALLCDEGDSRAGDPCLRVGQFGERRQRVGGAPDAIEALEPVRSTTSSQKRFPSRYWRSLVESEHVLEQPHRPVRATRRRSSASRSSACEGMTSAPTASITCSAWPSTTAIVAWMLDQDAPLAPDHERHELAAAKRLGRGPDVLDARQAHRLEGSMLDLERVDDLAHERGEMQPQPRHRSELDRVGHLVQRHPVQQLLAVDLEALAAEPRFGPTISRRATPVESSSGMSYWPSTR